MPFDSFLNISKAFNRSSQVYEYELWFQIKWSYVLGLCACNVIYDCRSVGLLEIDNRYQLTSLFSKLFNGVLGGLSQCLIIHSRTLDEFQQVTL